MLGRYTFCGGDEKCCTKVSYKLGPYFNDNSSFQSVDNEEMRNKEGIDSSQG